MPGSPIVILEGPDGSGKTTLAEALVAKGFAYEHRGPPEKPALQYYLDAINNHDGPLVIDRMHAGSYVYGKIFRGMDDLTDHERWILDGTVMARHGLMVYCRAPFEETQKNLERGPDNADAAIYEDPARRLAVRDKYEEYMYGGKLPNGGWGLNQLSTIRYDYTQGGMDHLVGMLADIEPVEHVSPVASVPAIGNTYNPEVIWVGDSHSGRSKGLQYIKRRGIQNPRRFMELLSAPFKWEPPFVSQSGRYLHLATMVGKIPLHKICLFDATQFDGRDVYDFIDREAGGWPHWQKAQWVALGQNASDRLTEANIPHRKVPHPSWWMRNKYKESREYAGLLKMGASW